MFWYATDQLIMSPINSYLFFLIHFFYPNFFLMWKLRVSTVMTNAPIILTQDCDMYSNDPQTPLRVLCYLCDPAIEPNLGFIQFPQRFPGINKNDTYGCEYKHLAEIHPIGFDGVRGPYYCGTGTFFRRRASISSC